MKGPKRLGATGKFVKPFWLLLKLAYQLKIILLRLSSTSANMAWSLPAY